VYERYAKAGGLLRYGIPDFKMEKDLVDMRVAQMEAEGVHFHYGRRHRAPTVPVTEARRLRRDRAHRRCRKITRFANCGRELDGIHFAMDFLPQQNRRVSGEPMGDVAPILAKDKRVIVIGGGDTGSDCIGTSIRQGAIFSHQFRASAAAALKENKLLSWRIGPQLRTSSTTRRAYSANSRF